MTVSLQRTIGYMDNPLQRTVSTKNNLPARDRLSTKDSLSTKNNLPARDRLSTKDSLSTKDNRYMDNLLHPYKGQSLHKGQALHKGQSLYKG
jgi:hypothetical protein